MNELKPEVIGLAAGIITASSLIPQLIKTIRTKQAEDVSVIMFLALMTGTGLWCYYGVLRDDLPLMITNGFSCGLNSCMMLLKLKYGAKT